MRVYGYVLIAFALIVLASMNTPLPTDPTLMSAAASVTLKDENSPGPEMQHMASIPYWDQDRAIEVVTQHVELFDYVTVFWYKLEAGEIVKYEYAEEDAMFVDFAQKNGVKVLALIANLPEEEGRSWDAEEVAKVISSPEVRAAHIADIVALLREKDFDGVNIDYEMLEDSQTEDFSAFIRELTEALHKEGKVVAVAVHAQYPGSETRGQDLKALQAADIISLMSYDNHWDTSDPGPSAGLPWVRSVLTHMRGLGVDMKKVFMGIPLYGYNWPREGSGWATAAGIEYKEIVELANSVETDILFDDTEQVPYFNYEKDGVEHELWFDNVRSVALKYDLAKEFGVKGVMFWRQGQEDMRMYDILK